LFFAAAVYASCGEIQAAQEYANATIALSQEQGFVQWLGGGMGLRGWVLACQGAPEQGIEELRQGLATWRGVGTELGTTPMLVLLAEAYWRGRQTEAGLRVVAEAFAIMHSNGERHREAELYRLQGELLLQQVNPDSGAAEANFQRALSVARHQAAKSLELRAAMSLSRLWQQQDKRAAAQHLLAEIYHWFTEGFETADLQAAQALLNELA
jgi:predicted ATPase